MKGCFQSCDILQFWGVGGPPSEVIRWTSSCTEGLGTLLDGRFFEFIFELLFELLLLLELLMEELELLERLELLLELLELLLLESFSSFFDRRFTCLSASAADLFLFLIDISS